MLTQLNVKMVKTHKSKTYKKIVNVAENDTLNRIKKVQSYTQYNPLTPYLNYKQVALEHKNYVNLN